MAQAITVKQTQGSRGTGLVVVRSDATGFLALNNAAAGANSTSSEVVTGMSIAGVAWSVSAGGSWTIARGGTTVFTCQAGSGNINFADLQMKVETVAQESANVQFTLSGTGTILLKIRKYSGEA